MYVAAWGQELKTVSIFLIAGLGPWWTDIYSALLAMLLSKYRRHNIRC